MRPKPYPRGRCHVANYWTQVQILSSNVTSSDSIAMPRETALFVGTVEHAPLRLALASMSTDRTRLARVAFLLQGYYHSVPLSLVGKQVPHGAMGPLMEFLIILGADIQVLPNIADIPNHKRLDTFSMQCRDQSACLFMFHIGDLMLEFLELFLLGTNEFLAATRTFLLPVDRLSKMLL